jgi:hypothetical protein
LPTQRSGGRVRVVCADTRSVEREIRQRLADKISGNLLGLWLLVPEHLRLGSWDLLQSGAAGAAEPLLAARLALHVVHEAALCRPTLRQDRSLRHRGLELVNGLPWLPTDLAIHDLLAADSVAQSHQFQIQLGQLRRASGHFPGAVLALDPHRLVSYSQRDMVRRPSRSGQAATKHLQTFFLLDADSRQPLCLTAASSACDLTRATKDLLAMAEQILPKPAGLRPLLVADVEHFIVELLDHVREQTSFDLLVPTRQTPALQRHYRGLPPGAFTRHWPGLAIATEAFVPRRSTVAEPCCRYIQRSGEQPEHYWFKGFVCTRTRPEVAALTRAFPDRWHIEEFFRFDQHLGWDRAGTLNLNVRLAQMSLALLAQTLIHQLRRRLGPPYDSWDAVHFARDFFGGLEGDLRVEQDTIVVTFYNAPDAHQWKHQFENLPDQLRRQKVEPAIPWLYGLKLDFRFR